MPKHDDLKFYTTTEIAEMLKMNVQVIARKLQHGEIPGYKIGKDWRVKESDLRAWLEKHSNKQRLSEAEKIINRFMKDGRFESMPAQRKKQIYLLEYILKQFKTNQIYSEREVNLNINKYHDDHCRIRRAFVDEKMMYRKDGKYRRNSSYKFQK